MWHRKVDVRLPGKGNSKSHGARPVHLIITMIKWIRTSRLSIKKSLSLAASVALDACRRPDVCVHERERVCDREFKCERMCDCVCVREKMCDRVCERERECVTECV